MIDTDALTTRPGQLLVDITTACYFVVVKFHSNWGRDTVELLPVKRCRDDPLYSPSWNQLKRLA